MVRPRSTDDDQIDDFQKPSRKQQANRKKFKEKGEHIVPDERIYKRDKSFNVRNVSFDEDDEF